MTPAKNKQLCHPQPSPSANMNIRSLVLKQNKICKDVTNFKTLPFHVDVINVWFLTYLL